MHFYKPSKIAWANEPCGSGKALAREAERRSLKEKLNCSQKFTSQLLKEFLGSRGSGISPKTIQLYHYALDRFIGFPLTPEGINSYLNSLSCGNGKTNYFRCIKTLFRWLHQNDYIESNPTEKVLPPRRQKKLLSAITEEQLGILLQHCDDRDKAIISLLYLTYLDSLNPEPVIESYLAP